MRTNLLASLAVAVLVLVLTGCGGGDDAKIDSKASFIKAADKVCADRDKRSVALAKATDNGNVADVTRQLAAIYDDTIAKISALPLPPGSARAGAHAYVTSTEAMQKPVDRMKASADAVEAAVKAKKGTAQVKTAVQQLQINVNTVQAIGDQADQNARDYGFKTCGQQQQINPVG
jgi:hypothetical protein